MLLPSADMSRSIDDIPLLRDEGLRSHTRLHRRDPIAFMRRLRDGGDRLRVRLLDKKVVVVTGPAQLSEVLVEKAAAMEKSSLFRYLIDPVGGEGLLSSRGALWRTQRKLMAPIFRVGQLARFADATVACARRDADTWRDGATIDMAREATRVTMSVAGKTFFGADIFSEADELGAARTEMIAWSGRQAMSWLPIAQIALRDAIERAAARRVRLRRGAAS